MTATHGRTDRASRIIDASPPTIYRAFIEPEALVKWLPPEGMTGEIDEFDLREGGRYRMTLTYADHAMEGKTSDNVDVVEGRFVELVPDEHVVQAIVFASDDPAFAGEMRMTWSLAEAPRGTEVTITCENVPAGIRQEDHDAGLKSTLANLAAYVE